MWKGYFCMCTFLALQQFRTFVLCFEIQFLNFTLIQNCTKSVKMSTFTVNHRAVSGYSESMLLTATKMHCWKEKDQKLTAYLSQYKNKFPEIPDAGDL